MPITETIKRKQLPGLSRVQQHLEFTQKFVVTFKQGIVKVCYGCCENFLDVDRPEDLILRRKLFREYPREGKWWRQGKLTNAYYHLRRECLMEIFAGKATFN